MLLLIHSINHIHKVNRAANSYQYAANPALIKMLIRLKEIYDHDNPSISLGYVTYYAIIITNN